MPVKPEHGKTSKQVCLDGNTTTNQKHIDEAINLFTPVRELITRPKVVQRPPPPPTRVSIDDIYDELTQKPTNSCRYAQNRPLVRHLADRTQNIVDELQIDEDFDDHVRGRNPHVSKSNTLKYDVDEILDDERDGGNANKKTSPEVLQRVWKEEFLPNRHDNNQLDLLLIEETSENDLNSSTVT